jgi:tRNA-binding EMAP/Myf-like protein
MANDILYKNWNKRGDEHIIEFTAYTARIAKNNYMEITSILEPQEVLVRIVGYATNATVHLKKKRGHGFRSTGLSINGNHGYIFLFETKKEAVEFFKREKDYLISFYKKQIKKLTKD